MVSFVRGRRRGGVEWRIREDTSLGRGCWDEGGFCEFMESILKVGCGDIWELLVDLLFRVFLEGVIFEKYRGLSFWRVVFERVGRGL